METCCVSIIKRIKDSFGWPGEIRTLSGARACIGELPKSVSEVDYKFSTSDTPPASMPLAASEEEMKALEDIASYQVLRLIFFYKFFPTVISSHDVSAVIS